jgi:hypothetical protein
VRRALIAAAVTSGMVAARRRRRTTPQGALPVQVPALAPVVPAQRAKIIDGDAELSVAEQESQDNRLLDLIDRL